VSVQVSRRRLPLVGDDAPELLGLPAPLAARQGLYVPDRDGMGPRVRALLGVVKDALLAPPPDGTVVVPLDGLSAPERHALWDMLGVGEVSIVVVGAARYEIEETSLPGVFRVRTRRDDGESLHLEVGAVPAVVRVAAEHGTSAELPLEDPPPPGLMNAQPLLAELRHRMTSGRHHVMSLTLLPLNDADATYLARVLGAGPVRAESRGYGTCRITATARRGIWAVQHYNAMDQLILDTLEVGDVPSALVAAPVDLEDSGVRLGELLGEAS